MDLIDRIRNDIDSRLEELRPQVEEIPRLESVLAALEAAADGQSEPRGAQARVRAFARLYNREWLIERHGFLTPLEAREHLLRQPAVA